MNYLVSNFFKFVSFEVKGLNLQGKFSNKNLYSDSYESNESYGNKKGDHSYKSSSPFSKDGTGLDLEFKSLEKKNDYDGEASREHGKTEDFNFEFVVDSIPKNLLVHMARLPYFFERLVYHSVGICFDSLLFELTFMPVQAITVLSYFVSTFTSYIVNEVKYVVENDLFKPFLRFFKLKKKESSTKLSKSKSKDSKVENMLDSSRDSPRSARLNWKTNSNSNYITLTEVCGSVRFLVLVSTIYIFSFIDTSKVYHYIKGQPVMKLYVIFNMLEICERLCRSFSRDIMDSLIRTTITIFVSHFPDHDKENDDNSHGSSLNEMKLKGSNLSDNKYDKSINSNKNNQTDPSSKNPDINAFFNKLAIKHEDFMSFFSKVTKPEDNNNNSNNKSKNALLKSDKKDDKSQRGANKYNVNEKRKVKNISLERNYKDGDGENKEKKDTDNKNTNNNNNNNKENNNYRDVESEFLTAKGTHFLPLESFFGNDNFENILNSCRKYSDSFNIYYKLVFLYFFVVLTISFHSFLHLVRVLSLNIAINSPETTMFLLLITNNFSEIKSTVFKKYDSLTLFVIFASDAVERCYLFFDGLLVFLKMSTSKRHLKSYVNVFSWLVVIYALEMLIDLVKHSYLIKFNRIRSETFEKYNSTLISDTLLSRSVYNLGSLTNSKFQVPCKGSFSFSHISSRRLGFMSSPIVTLIICSLPKLGVYLSVKTFTISALLWLSLFSFKVSSSILLTAYAIKKREQLYNLDSMFYKIGAL